MQVSFRLAQLLGAQSDQRGLINKIARRTKIERHTVSALLNNQAKYVSLQAISRLCDYLMKYHGYDARTLPGALFGSEPKTFWLMLARCQQLDFFVGARTSKEWPSSNYVMSTDSHLQAALLSTVSQMDVFELEQELEVATRREFGREPRHGVSEEQDAGKEHGDKTRHRYLPFFHHVYAPEREIKPDSASAHWERACQRAVKLYERAERHAMSRASIVLGSVKVNPVLELMLGKVFRATPFVAQDNVATPAMRSCPFMFRYRDIDPQPPSCLGGVRISAKKAAKTPGIYYEDARGRWVCCPVDDDNDAGFVFHAYHKPTSDLDLACGGFSSRATGWMATNFSEIAAYLGNPQFSSPGLTVGLFIIKFRKVKPRVGETAKEQDYEMLMDLPDCEFEVIPLAERVVARRIAPGKRTQSDA